MDLPEVRISGSVGDPKVKKPQLLRRPIQYDKGRVAAPAAPATATRSGRKQNNKSANAIIKKLGNKKIEIDWKNKNQADSVGLFEQRSSPRPSNKSDPMPGMGSSMVADGAIIPRRLDENADDDNDYDNDDIIEDHEADDVDTDGIKENAEGGYYDGEEGYCDGENGYCDGENCDCVCAEDCCEREKPKPWQRHEKCFLPNFVE